VNARCFERDQRDPQGIGTTSKRSEHKLASGCSMFVATHGVNLREDSSLCVDTGHIDDAMNGGREGEGGSKETQ